jgi:peptidoglycan hydrolase-like protein with peptidoglycan-binding domain
MKTTTIMQRNKSFFKPIFLATTTLLLAPSLAFAAFAQINTQLDIGETNADVTRLQTFLASNPAVYPEGLITGYYGPLTRSAVERFQAMENIVNSGTAVSTGFGRVGPSTLAKLNQIIASGSWTGGSTGTAGDVSGPQFLNLTKNIGNTSATFTWTTNEPATAKMFYDTNYVRMNEGNIDSTGFGSITGMTNFGTDNQLRTTQSVTLTNLQPNTVYYYTPVATDANGNVSVVGPNDSFRTGY